MLRPPRRQAAPPVQVDTAVLSEAGIPDRLRAPGLLLAFTNSEPRSEPIKLPKEPLMVGRGQTGGVAIEDASVSRQHARVSQQGGDWVVEDLDSRNGTWVDGIRIEGTRRGPFRVLRTGGTLFVLAADIGPMALSPLRSVGRTVMGPATQAVFEEIARIASASSTLHVTGESGTGKELAARAFHDHGPRPQGPFVAVNCATIPKELAERLLFGARKGAYSGADRDSEGYLQAAHRGTLFLDEVGELEPAIQAKLLRVLETRDVLPLGATRPQPVELRLFSATLRSLRQLVGDGRFREDLYFRLGRPGVELPPLRERPEEIPWLIKLALDDVGSALRVRASFVEACMLRTWPGNVRELLTEVRTAALAATAKASDSLDETHLSAAAGQSLAAESRGAPPRTGRWPSDAEIEAALAANDGRVASAARALGMHRTQLRRWIEKVGKSS